MDEVEGGIVSRYEILPEPGTEHPYFEASLRGHLEGFGKTPHLLAADRGLSSLRKAALAHQAGVKRVRAGADTSKLLSYNEFRTSN